MISGQLFIGYDEYPGDFDLKTTMYSGQTSQPPWKEENRKYYETITLDEEQVLVEISQKECNEELKVNFYSENDIDEEKLIDMLFYIFDLDYDITKVYDYLDNNEELNEVYNFNKGLRLFKAQFPYECIISSICSANNSIKRWTKSVNQIKQAYGEKLAFNGKEYYQFPKENEFITIPDSEKGLKSYGVGYRSSYMLNSTKMILGENNYHQKISNLSYDKAFNKITELEGVGPKVADCILLYGYNKHEAYPVDVWINRITTHLYFKGQKPTNKKIMNFAQDKFGDYSGYIQLYLFNYARLSGLTEKLKANK